MDLAEYRQKFETAFTGMVQVGEYRMAWRIYRHHRKTLRLVRSKIRHQKRWKKLKVEATQLHHDISVLALGYEIDYHNASVKMTKEDQ